MFSSGHDIGSKEADRRGTTRTIRFPTTYGINGEVATAPEKRMLQEWHYFFQNTIRWRNLRKITIAQVHGNVYPRA